jgi:hypothetical protein
MLEQFENDKSVGSSNNGCQSQTTPLCRFGSNVALNYLVFKRRREESKMR